MSLVSILVVRDLRYLLVGNHHPDRNAASDLVELDTADHIEQAIPSLPPQPLLLTPTSTRAISLPENEALPGPIEPIQQVEAQPQGEDDTWILDQIIAGIGSLGLTEQQQERATQILTAPWEQLGPAERQGLWERLQVIYNQLMDMPAEQRQQQVDLWLELAQQWWQEGLTGQGFLDSLEGP
jgi:hypothetical protein